MSCSGVKFPVSSFGIVSGGVVTAGAVGGTNLSGESQSDFTSAFVSSFSLTSPLHCIWLKISSNFLYPNSSIADCIESIWRDISTAHPRLILDTIVGGLSAPAAAIYTASVQ